MDISGLSPVTVRAWAASEAIIYRLEEESARVARDAKDAAVRRELEACRLIQRADAEARSLRYKIQYLRNELRLIAEGYSVHGPPVPYVSSSGDEGAVRARLRALEAAKAAKDATTTRADAGARLARLQQRRRRLVGEYERLRRLANARRDDIVIAIIDANRENTGRARAEAASAQSLRRA